MQAWIAAGTRRHRGISDEERDLGCVSGEGRAIIAKVDPKFTLRAWQATFAGERTGAIAVAVEYPGDFAAFATAWSRLVSDKAVSEWLCGLSGLRTIASDSLYQEIGL